MGIRVATDTAWRHATYGQQGLSKTRHTLTQLHCPMMLKLVMVGRSFPSYENNLSVLLQARAIFLSAKGGTNGIRRTA